MIILTQTDINISVAEYLVAGRARGLSARTIDIYGYNLRRLSDWLAGRGVVRLADVSRLLLREWAAALWDRWRPNTIKGAVTAARSWLRWCWEERRISDPIHEALRVPVARMTRQRTVFAADVERILAGCRGTPSGCRARALVSLLYDSGIRAAEVATLTLPHLDLERHMIYVVAKGGQLAPGGFGDRTAVALRDWLRIREEIAAPGCATLFVALGGRSVGRPLSPGAVGKIVRQAGRLVNVECSPHDFRRGFAVALADAGVPDTTLSKLGRWSSTQMIRRYTQAQIVHKSYISPLDQNNDQ
jgi:integrase/recombinase XerC